MKLVSTTLVLSTAIVTGSVLILSSGKNAGANPVPAAQAENAPANLNGKWKLSFIDPKGNARQGTLELHQTGSSLTGSYTGPRGTFPAAGSAQGNRVAFTLSAKGKKLSFTGNVEGDKMSGTAETGSSWSASRQ